jgi:hypothetical protein
MLLCQRVIKFLDKPAYIRITLIGEGLCTAAPHAFPMILSNAARFAVLGSVSDIFVFLGKCLITASSSTWIGFLLLARIDHSDCIVSPVPIALVFGLVSYVVSQCS